MDTKTIKDMDTGIIFPKWLISLRISLLRIETMEIMRYYTEISKRYWWVEPGHPRGILKARAKILHLPRTVFMSHSVFIHHESRPRSHHTPRKLLGPP